MKGKILVTGLILLCGVAVCTVISQAQTVTNAVPAGPVAPPAGVPVGTVVGWLKSVKDTPALPPEWVECNGQVLELPDSVYHGQAMPNLNGAGEEPRRFLRGAPESGAKGGEEFHVHLPQLIERGGKHNLNVSSRKAASNLPPYYEVTWIMKVR